MNFFRGGISVDPDACRKPSLNYENGTLSYGPPLHCSKSSPKLCIMDKRKAHEKLMKQQREKNENFFLNHALKNDIYKWLESNPNRFSEEDFSDAYEILMGFLWDSSVSCMEGMYKMKKKCV